MRWAKHARDDLERRTDPVDGPATRETTTVAPEIGWPEVAETALDEPALVRAGVETGDAPLGTLDGADAWETEPAAPCDPLLVPGTEATGSEATGGAFADGTLGTVIEGTLGAVTEGTVTDGTVTPGTVTPGTVTEGTVTPGTVTPGTVTDGVVTPGTVTDELPGTDTVSDGSVSALLARGCIAKTASSESPRAATAAIQRPARVGRPPVRGVCRVPIGLPLIASNTYPTLTKLNRLSTAARLSFRPDPRKSNPRRSSYTICRVPGLALGSRRRPELV